MRRRLNIGAGLVHSPTLLVLDEPTVGVDPQSRHAIMSSVRGFGEAGLAVLYTTHYMEEAERLCHRIGIIDRGRLVAEGTRRELVESVGEQDRIQLVATGDSPPFADRCRALPGVGGVDIDRRSAAPARPRRQHGCCPRCWSRPSAAPWSSRASRWSSPTWNRCSCT